MKFSNRVDIAAPAEVVFGQLSDFPDFERAARRKGASVNRLDALTAAGAGMSWEGVFKLRGRQRRVIVDLKRYDFPEQLEYEGTSQGFLISLTLQLVELSKGKTRLITGLEVKPRTLGARLLVQSAKLGRGSLDRRYDERVKAFARRIEARVA